MSKYRTCKHLKNTTFRVFDIFTFSNFWHVRHFSIWETLLFVRISTFSIDWQVQDVEIFATFTFSIFSRHWRLQDFHVFNILTSLRFVCSLVWPFLYFDTSVPSASQLSMFTTLLQSYSRSKSGTFKVLTCSFGSPNSTGLHFHLPVSMCSISRALLVS